MTAYLLVRSGPSRYGLPLADVVEVADVGEVVRVPGAHPAVRGVSPVRGRLLPLVHLDGLLRGLPGPAQPPATVIVAGPAERRVAFEVDEVDLQARGEILPVPSEWEGPSAVGVARHEGGMVPVLDLRALVARLDAARSGDRDGEHRTA
jgi:chemotaxis signal transduction protein